MPAFSHQSQISSLKSSIPLLLLAAGGSTRLGRPKQLLPIWNTTLLRHAAETALASRCSPVIVVLGVSADTVGEAIVGLPVNVVINPHWSRGMGTSLRLGLQTVLEMGESPAVILMVCDQPAVTPQLIGELLAAHAQGASLVAASYAGTVGVPALIGREWFSELLALDDDAGARELFKRHPAEVVTIPFPEGALDVDTQADYQSILSKSSDRFHRGSDRR